MIPQFSRVMLHLWHTHPALQAVTAIAVSGMWCWAGLQECKKKRVSGGMSWILIGVAILAIAILGFIVDHAWSGALIALLGLIAGAVFCFKSIQGLVADSNGKWLTRTELENGVMSGLPTNHPESNDGTYLLKCRVGQRVAGLRKWPPQGGAGPFDTVEKPLRVTRTR